MAEQPTDLARNRIILLIGGRTYRADSFVRAAEKLGLEVVKGIDLPKDLAEFYKPTLPLEFRDVDGSAARVVAYAKENPVRAVLSVDDDATVIAAVACDELDLTANAPIAAYAAKNKSLMRERLAQASVKQPSYQLFSSDDDPSQISEQVEFPCVVKPILLAASQGVIRANNATEFVEAFKCTKEIVSTFSPPPPHQRVGKDWLARSQILVEKYVEGVEVAVEGILSGGQLKVLAVFDKPDPLVGPLFEETIYVTPSRLSSETQEIIVKTAVRACAALGLRDGPIHAELRVDRDAAWVIEVAGRSIGGLCSKTLRFGKERMSLEELILRHAVGEDVRNIEREQSASGVMMIPIPSAGLLKRVTGLAEARAVPGVEEIDITIALNHPVIPLPFGNQYLGFIFARGETPDQVELALREAHRRLDFEITEQIQLSPNA